MKRYQDILRDQTSRNFAAKRVTTSMLMLPLRLETKIMNKNVDTTNEPERALDAFRSLQHLLQSYHELVCLKNKAKIEKATRLLKQEMKNFGIQF